MLNRSYALLCVAAVVLEVGCAPAYDEPMAAAPPPPPATVYAQAPPAAPPPPAPAYAEAPPPPAPAQPVDDDSADVVYETEPPFVDIETYPSVVYGGVPVYFVGGRWYRHDARGWGYLRSEPPELARNRAAHERDAQWVRARQARPRAVPRRGVTAPQPPERRR